MTTRHDTSDDLFANGGSKGNKTVPITVEGMSIPTIIDLGSHVNVLNSDTFNLLEDKKILLRNT